MQLIEEYTKINTKDLTNPEILNSLNGSSIELYGEIDDYFLETILPSLLAKVRCASYCLKSNKVVFVYKSPLIKVKNSIKIINPIFDINKFKPNEILYKKEFLLNLPEIFKEVSKKTNNQTQQLTEFSRMLVKQIIFTENLRVVKSEHDILNILAVSIFNSYFEYLNFKDLGHLINKNKE